MDKNRCGACGRLTSLGEQAERERWKKTPIFGTDFSKPINEIIEQVRVRLIAARGTLHDINSATGWGERIDPIIGLITCGIAELYHVGMEIKSFEEKKIDQKES